MVLVVQPSDADADDDAAEDAHLKREDTAARRDRAFEHRRRDRSVRKDLAADFQHGVARCVHDEEGNHGRKRRDLLLRLRHADGDADGEDDRQVAEDRAARARHDGEKRVKRRSCTEYGGKSVRLDGRGVRERRAEPQEYAGDRQDGDGQHEAASDALEYTENFVFHDSENLLSGELLDSSIPPQQKKYYVLIIPQREEDCKGGNVKKNR